MISGLCDRLEEYKLSILCLSLAYGALLENPSATMQLEQATLLRHLSIANIRMGNYESARKTITIAVNLDDLSPIAN